jgi:hypothetical protein
MNPDPVQQQIQLKITDEDLKGRYANAVKIGFTPEEFILDFANIFPPIGIYTARLFISPAHLKRISNLIQEQLSKYEKVNGKLKPAEEPSAKIGFSV